MALQFPKGKFVSIVKVGEKGQIVIPKGARDLFQIQPGDSLLLLADEKQGIALVAADAITAAPELFSPNGKEEEDHGSSES